MTGIEAVKMAAVAARTLVDAYEPPDADPYAAGFVEGLWSAVSLLEEAEKEPQFAVVARGEGFLEVFGPFDEELADALTLNAIGRGITEGTVEVVRLQRRGSTPGV